MDCSELDYGLEWIGLHTGMNRILFWNEFYYDFESTGLWTEINWIMNEKEMNDKLQLIWLDFELIGSWMGMNLIKTLN